MKWNIVLGGCCIVLLGFNLALVNQNRQLKAQFSMPAQNLEVPAGTKVPDLKGYNLDGKPVQLEYGRDQRKVLMLVFSPTCHFCEQNWPKWYDLLSGLDRKVVQPVGVDVTALSTASFLTEHHLNDILVMVQVDPAAKIDYRLQLTPQTLLINRNGKIEKVWSGVLDDAAVAEIKKRVSEEAASLQPGS